MALQRWGGVSGCNPCFQEQILAGPILENPKRYFFGQSYNAQNKLRDIVFVSWLRQSLSVGKDGLLSLLYLSKTMRPSAWRLLWNWPMPHFIFKRCGYISCIPRPTHCLLPCSIYFIQEEKISEEMDRYFRLYDWDSWVIFSCFKSGDNLGGTLIFSNRRR